MKVKGCSRAFEYKIPPVSQKMKIVKTTTFECQGTVNTIPTKNGQTSTVVLKEN